MTPERWQEVKKVLAGALEQTPEQRRVYLDQACTDPDLRREVESLITAHEEGNSNFMEQPPLDTASLKTGTRLGPYTIQGNLGAGGMGEVYRAHDPKLKRDVAIKVLPLTFVNAPERLARFQREARLLASLNHPNIATIYGLEDSDGTHALVMELVEGPTLADRIRQGPIEIEDALPIAKQMAEALEYAHEHGIIHRDLKPANVKVTADDTVKILDFGLAKVMGRGPSTAHISKSPTLSQMATQANVLLGTAAYMSPEQAKAKPVDRRADIWAFGCVLYEILTGKTAFQGDSVADTLTAVIKNEPDWSLLPTITPMRIRVLLQRCLQKDPKQRLRDIGDARISLDEVLSGAVEGTPALGATVPTWRRAIPWVTTALFFFTTAGLAFVHLRATQLTSSNPVRFAIPMPRGVTPAVLASFAISPDGRQLAFFGTGADGVTRLWVRPLDSLEARPLLGSETSIGPPFFWSPDSRYIVFDAGRRLKKIAIAGGPAQTICDVPSHVVDGSWSRDGVIIFGRTNGPLMRVPAAGGTATPLTALDPARKEDHHSRPFFLPDGRHFVYFRGSSSPEYTGAYVGSLDVRPEAQNLKQLVATPRGVEYVPFAGKGTGYLLFVRDRALLAQAFDPYRLKLSGEPVEIADHIGSSLDVSASANGVVVYRSGSASALGGSQLTWLDRHGKVQGAPETQPGSVGDIAISPDARRVALTAVAPDWAVWLHDFQRGTTTRLTFSTPSAVAPVWSPDGTMLTFTTDRGNLYQKPADGSKNEELILKSQGNTFPTSWSRDGRFILYSAPDPKTNDDVWVLPLKGGGKPFPLLQTNSNETDGQFSPGAHWIAYTSDESGREEIYIRPFSPDAAGVVGRPGAKWQISTDGGRQPRWRGDGRELYYITTDNKIMAVEVATAPSFRAGVPKVLFQAHPVALTLPSFRPWDVTSDGQRFLFITPDAASEQAPLTVMLNWPSLLKN